jgi:putative holliday junction resolvase
MGIDFGEVRIGIAVSDPTGTLASPVATLRRRRGKRPPFRAIEELVHAHQVEALVLGLPLELDGSESDWTREVRRAGDALGRRTGLPIHYVDERFTSVEAEALVRSSGLPRGKREEKARIDQGAAALILQRWLDQEEGSEG